MKKILRTFYLNKVSGEYKDSKFEVGKIDDQAARTIVYPVIGEEVDMSTIERMVENGNRIVLIPRRDGFRIYQDGSYEE